MTTEAIIMMIVAIVIFWGGMTFCILRLRRHPDIGRTPDAEVGSADDGTAEGDY